jgi:hypothetical protein
VRRPDLGRTQVRGSPHLLQHVRQPLFLCVSTPADWADKIAPAHRHGTARPDSRVDIVATAVADLKGVARVLGGLASGRIPVDRIRAHLGRSPLAA